MAEQEKLDFHEALRQLTEVYQNNPDPQERRISCVMRVRCEVSIYLDTDHPGTLKVAVDALAEDENVDTIDFDSNGNLETEDVLGAMEIDPTLKQWGLSEE